ncbi:ATP-binding domain-containing protein [Fundicoccus sp. Sow4_D5]|uniref:nuclease-related domain-containing DEAD/DEAH box helicase n=1 Tax=Fundicoccus sp. Sow4_D5 TaxID=3438782 RepID=UPI003F8DF94D
MVLLIPDNRLTVEFNGSIGEAQLYERFNSLNDNFFVFHSVRWMNKNNKYLNFGETDYVIFDKTRGIICLEVKHGGLKGSNGRIYQINRRTKEEVEINPMFQADKSKYFFIDKLTSILYKHKVKIPIYSAVLFSGIDKKGLNGSLPNEYKVNGNTFFNDDMNDLNGLIDSFFRFHNVSQIELSNKVVKDIVDLISPEFGAFPSLSNAVKQHEFLFNQMTNQQSYLLDYLEEQKSAAVQGGAGTGKTMIAVEKAKRISEDKEVVFLCFNNMLVSFLQTRYSKELPNVHFTNLYQLAAKALKKKVNEEEIQHFLNNVEDYPEIWSFDNIIIDEGQDFASNQIEVLREIAMLREGFFYVFYDKNQLVQQRNELSWLQLMECRLVLSINCRNTKSIAETSVAPLDISEVKMRLAIEGDIPIFHHSPSKDEFFYWIHKRIEFYHKEGILLTNIVIITTKTIEKSILKDTDKIGNYLLSHTVVDNSLLFTTSRKFKGLEADVVILIDVDADTFNHEEARRVFYVGASRAKSYLEIISTMPLELETDLYESISRGGSKRKSALLSGLKVKLM